MFKFDTVLHIYLYILAKYVPLKIQQPVGVSISGATAIARGSTLRRCFKVKTFPPMWSSVMVQWGGSGIRWLVNGWFYDGWLVDVNTVGEWLMVCYLLVPKFMKFCGSTSFLDNFGVNFLTDNANNIRKMCLTGCRWLQSLRSSCGQCSILEF